MNLKSLEEINIMAEGGHKLGAVLERLRKEVRIGITTLSLDELAFALIKEAGAEPAFLHYRPAGAEKAYPYTLCASVNEVVVHGQPSEYIIKEGDVVKLDLGLKYGGFNVDAAITVGVGSISREAKKLIAITEDALKAGINEAKVGHTLGDVGYAIQKIVEKGRYSIAEGLTGHGIGRDLHEDPPVFNFGKPKKGEALVPGMVLAIEPMVAIGGGQLIQLKNDSYATVDNSLAAHFEHTVAITKDGPRILTKS